MTDVDIALRLLAASQVILTALAFLRSANPPPVRAATTLFCIGVLAYLMLPLTLGRWHWGASNLLLLTAANAIPVLLYWLTRLLFEEKTRLPSAALVAAVIYLGLSLMMDVREHTYDGGGTIRTASKLDVLIAHFVTQVVKLGFTIAAIATIWRGREDDLVEIRRKIRRWFAVVLTGTVLAVIVVELVTVWHVPALIERVGMAAILALALAVNLSFLKLNPSFELTARRQPASVASANTTAANPILAGLDTLMRDEALYRDHDLRIAAVAGRLAVPEHRLRKTINQELGYRNFNQFVNEHRIAAAAERLLQEPSLPILSIALDVGFRSLSSFNQAFKTIHATTPTEYRNLRLTDSPKP